MASPGQKARARIPEHAGDYYYAFQQYRAGRSIQESADDIGVKRQELFDRISKEGITQDLALLIRNKTSDILAGDVVDANGRLPVTPEDIIQINATLQASVIRSHRKDIDRFRKLVMRFLDELEGQTMYNDLLEDLGTMMRSENRNGEDKLNDAYKKVISLPGRTDTLKKLGETLKILILLERQAFGMRDDYEDDEIRKSKTTTPDTPAVSNFDSITRRFMKAMGKDEVIDVEEARPAIPAS